MKTGKLYSIGVLFALCLMGFLLAMPGFSGNAQVIETKQSAVAPTTDANVKLSIPDTPRENLRYLDAAVKMYKPVTNYFDGSAAEPDMETIYAPLCFLPEEQTGISYPDTWTMGGYMSVKFDYSKLDLIGFRCNGNDYQGEYNPAPWDPNLGPLEPNDGTAYFSPYHISAYYFSGAPVIDNGTGHARFFVYAWDIFWLDWPIANYQEVFSRPMGYLIFSRMSGAFADGTTPITVDTSETYSSYYSYPRVPGKVDVWDTDWNVFKVDIQEPVGEVKIGNAKDIWFESTAGKEVKRAVVFEPMPTMSNVGINGIYSGTDLNAIFLSGNVSDVIGGASPIKISFAITNVLGKTIEGSIPLNGDFFQWTVPIRVTGGIATAKTNNANQGNNIPALANNGNQGNNDTFNASSLPWTIKIKAVNVLGCETIATTQVNYDMTIAPPEVLVGNDTIFDFCKFVVCVNGGKVEASASEIEVDLGPDTSEAASYFPSYNHTYSSSAPYNVMGGSGKLKLNRVGTSNTFKSAPLTPINFSNQAAYFQATNANTFIYVNELDGVTVRYATPASNAAPLKTKRLSTGTSEQETPPENKIAQIKESSTPFILKPGFVKYVPNSTVTLKVSKWGTDPAISVVIKFFDVNGKLSNEIQPTYASQDNDYFYYSIVIPQNLTCKTYHIVYDVNFLKDNVIIKLGTYRKKDLLYILDNDITVKAKLIGDNLVHVAKNRRVDFTISNLPLGASIYIYAYNKEETKSFIFTNEEGGNSNNVEGDGYTLNVRENKVFVISKNEKIKPIMFSCYIEGSLPTNDTSTKQMLISDSTPAVWEMDANNQPLNPEIIVYEVRIGAGDDKLIPVQKPDSDPRTEIIMTIKSLPMNRKVCFTVATKGGGTISISKITLPAGVEAVDDKNYMYTSTSMNETSLVYKVKGVKASDQIKDVSFSAYHVGLDGNKTNEMVAKSEYTCVQIKNVKVLGGATQKDVNQNITGKGDQNWACAKTVLDDEYTLVEIDIQPKDEGIASKVDWTYNKADAGEEVPGNKYQRRYKKNAAIKWTVQPAIKEETINPVYIWVIWSTVTIRCNRGDNLSATNDAKFPIEFGGDELGPVNNEDNGITGSATLGKVEIMATLEPAGINTVIQKGWRMRRVVTFRVYMNGLLMKNGAEVNKADNSLNKYLDLTPQMDDNIYDIDAPSCGYLNMVRHTAEVYENFSQWVMWHHELCSDLTLWHYQARVDADLGIKDTVLNDVGVGHIIIPDTAFFETR